MLDKLTGLPAHKYLQVLGTLILAVGLPLNKVVMSIGTIWLASNLLLKGDYKLYYNQWRKHPVAWFIIVLFLLPLIGLLYTNDLSYAFRDLKTKLPLFVVPLALIGYPLIKKHIHFVLKGFLFSLLITSIINWLNISFLTNGSDNISFREVSLFGSHIRYSLLIVMGFSGAIYFSFKEPRRFFVWTPLVVWFAYYTVFGQVLGGYLAFVFVIVGMLIFAFSLLKNNLIRYGSYFILTLAFLSLVYSVLNYFSPNQQNVVFVELPEFTEQGNKYYHDTTFYWFENGNHVMSFISEKELKKEWNERSLKPYESLDSSGHKLKSVIWRYMSSKGLTKDSAGVSKLTLDDIKNIERGMTSIEKQANSPFRRFETLKNQIQNYSTGGDPDGNSLLQRFEHWKAALHIIKNNWLFGVGTGDVQDAFNEAYTQSNSQLDPKHWNRAHNQFFTFWITFGVLGFILFLIFWKYLFFLFYKRKNFLGICFTFIIVSSFLSEDTLETQQGVTFAALFIGLLLGLNKESSKVKSLK